MIARIWHGWTTHQNAEAYENLLRSEIFHGIAERGIAGYRGIELLRRQDQDLTEFVTIMWFDSFEAVRVLPIAAGLMLSSDSVPPTQPILPSSARACSSMARTST